MIRLCLVAFLASLSVHIFAQSGPGGVRNNTSNLFWLEGNVGLFENSGLVTTWEDQAISNDATPPTSREPSYNASAINGLPGVTFFSGTELSIANSGNINQTTFSARTIFIAFRTPSSFAGTQMLYEEIR